MTKSILYLAVIAVAFGLAQTANAQPVELTCKTQFSEEGRVILDESSSTAAFLFGTNQLVWGDNESASFTDTEVQWKHVCQTGKGYNFSLSRMTGELTVSGKVNEPTSHYQCRKAARVF